MGENLDLAQEIGHFGLPHSRHAFEGSSVAIGQGAVASHMQAGEDTALLSMVQRVFLAQTQPAPRMAVVAGFHHGSGCSRTAADIAETLAAHADGTVCLVEGNLRSPSLANVLAARPPMGLADALLEEDPIQSFTTTVCGGRLHLLAAGNVGAQAFLLRNSDRVKSRFAELRRAFSYVIIDAPPITRYADAVVLGQVSDGVILVVEAGTTRRQVARSAVDTLRSSQVPILAAVLNNRVFPIPRRIYNRL